jgi:AraC-like DNA-binding protein
MAGIIAFFPFGRFAVTAEKCRCSCQAEPGLLRSGTVMNCTADATGKSGFAAPVERLVLVDEVTRPRTGTFRSQSLPGHLLHIVTSGTVSQWAEGRAEVLHEGTVVWYHENEPVRGEILRAPWRFVTINFLAPSLPPPPDERRVFQAAPSVLRLGRALLSVWRDRGRTALERQIHSHLALLELLRALLPHTGLQTPSQTGARLWWRVEKQLRLRLEETHSLVQIQKMSGLSLRTMIRACRAATGMPPMRRLKELRLGYARGLVQHSDLPMTEIALRIGYTRPQEFSRDFHRRFKICPRSDRRRTPSYRHMER